MAISIEAREDLVTLVVGMFDAAPGAAVLTDLTVAYEDGIANGGSSADVMAGIAANLASSSFYKAIYPEFLTNSEFTTKLVNNLAGDTLDGAAKADASALLLAQLNGMDTSTAASKAAARAAVTMTAIAAIESAAADDETFGALSTQFSNKVEVATYYSVDQQENITGLADAQDVIKDVDETEASVTAAKEAIDGTANAGDDFDLTGGVDDLTGTNADDTFTALSVQGSTSADTTTFSSFDEIDGGDGEDTLNIYTNVDGAPDFNSAFPSSASVKNVEIINIYNEEDAADLADASNYEGVEQLWQIGEDANTVENLGASTTAGFRGTEEAALNVEAAAATASVALDNVSDDGNAKNNNIVALNIEGDDLNTVNISGDIAAIIPTGANRTKRLDLTVDMGDDEDTLTLNTAANANLVVNDGADEDLVELDASGSTGGVTFTGDDEVHTITGGSGDDDLTIGYDFTASVETATVNSGAGDDTVTIDGDAGIYSVNTGAGDDTVEVAEIGELDTDSTIDGGEGTDTIETEGGAALDAEDYTLLNNLFVNFESITFTDAGTEFDASRLSDYKSFTTEDTATITKVADDQSVAIEADATITAAGYSAATTPNTYAGELSVSSSTGDATATVNAETVNLTVGAALANDNETTLEGDVKEAVVTVNNFAVPGQTAWFGEASVVIETVDGADTGGAGTALTEQLDALTSVTLSGTGSATVTNGVDTALVTVDASELNTVDDEGDATTGLTYETSNKKAETVSLGDGYDALTVNGGASTVAAMDTINGFTIGTDEDGDFDNTASDILTFNSAAADDLESLGEIDANSLDLALVDALAEIGNGSTAAYIFDFDGDSYVFFDTVNNGVVDDGDSLIKLTGGVDHDLAIAGAVDA
ncbi:MAG: hypothetical protein P1V33_00685 [Pseudohongiella nitratireducens]|nr:hypothetical protein [Pseudohongiella nitratireducens]MDF1621971.1 hypothetical protein [Pseudohongiella nitratireducens]